MDVNEAISVRWAVAAARAPRIAARRVLVRAVLLAAMLPGGLLLFNVGSWAVRDGAGVPFVAITLHVAIILVALGLPARSDTLQMESLYLRASRDYLGSRVGRLRAIGRALLIEVVVLFLHPLLMTVIAGHRLQWPVYFVIAFGAWIINWPLHRLAMAQRHEADRLISMDR